MSASLPERDPRSGCLQPPPEDVRQQLGRILASPAFAANALRKALFRYLVDEALAGRADRVKGFTIAIAVFGRDESFDSQSDPVVRLEARRLRRDLDGYYATAGVRDPVRIAVPKGAYVAQFSWQEFDWPDAGQTAAVPPEADAKVASPEVASTKAIPATPDGRPRFRLGAALVALTMMIGAVGGWLWSERRHAASTIVAAVPQEHATTVIVLPFEVLSADAADSYLAVGLSQQLITDLMRFAGLKLYSVPASFRQSPSADPVNVGRDLTVAYVVKGSLRSGSGMVRLSVSLVDAASGQVLWSETYDRPLTPESVLEVQADLATHVATRLGQPFGVIRQVANDRLANDKPQTMAAYACVLQAYAYRRTFARELYAPVRSCLEDAVHFDASYADAWALLAFVHLDAVRFGHGPEAEVAAEMEQAMAAASQAVELAPQNLLSLKAMATITYYRGAFDQAEAIQRQVLALSPNDPEAMAQLGWRLAMRGRWQEGLGYLTQATDRSIDPPAWYHFSFAVHDYMTGDYAHALEAAEKAKKDGIGVGWSLVAMIQAALGREDEARRALAEMAARSSWLAHDPAGYYRFQQVDERIVESLVDGLRKAGWKQPNAQAAAAEK